ncbi:MAG: hypothetical protein HYS64_01310 [Rhodospirillales bacterium]|nr:hypothetical protein [Rhodospirillales bacterium]
MLRILAPLLVFSVAVPLLLAIALGPATAKTVFHAVCGSLQGQRVEMDPDGANRRETWRPDFYRAGPPPDGQGTLEFISEDSDRDHVGIKWGGPARALPIVYRSDSQISLADVDDSGVWIFTLFYRAGKVLVTRQTTTSGPGSVGALLTGECQFKPQ